MNMLPRSDRFLKAQPARSVTTPAPAAQGTHCPIRALTEQLRQAGLRPTRQRIQLGWLLFGKGDRHVCAEQLYSEAQTNRINLSLATVYNTLNQFTEAGLLRAFATTGDRMFYDTNTGDHHHCLVEQTGEVFDLPEGSLQLVAPPEAPAGYRVAGVDIVVRLERIEEAPHQAPAGARM